MEGRVVFSPIIMDGGRAALTFISERLVACLWRSSQMRASAIKLPWLSRRNAKDKTLSWTITLSNFKILKYNTTEYGLMRSPINSSRVHAYPQIGLHVIPWNPPILRHLWQCVHPVRRPRSRSRTWIVFVRGTEDNRITFSRAQHLAQRIVLSFRECVSIVRRE
jgi:hypothetical protein